MTVTVKRIGGSIGVLIPKTVAQEMRLTEGTALEVTNNDNQIVMQRRGKRARRPLKKLVKQMNRAAYSRHRKEFLDGPAVGKEYW